MVSTETTSSKSPLTDSSFSSNAVEYNAGSLPLIRQLKSLLIIIAKQVEFNFENICAGRLKPEELEDYSECLKLAIDTTESVYKALEQTELKQNDR